MTNGTVSLLLYALAQVESGGRADAVNGRAVGPLQVTPHVIRELDRRGVRDQYGARWVHGRCREPRYATACCLAYLRAVAPGGSAERWARTWRKGPSGWQSRTAAAYWRRVRAVMESGERLGGRKSCREAVEAVWGRELG